MFWGLIMEPNKRYSQTVRKSFHISMASQDGGLPDDKPSQIICSYGGRNFLLCTLQYPNVMQCPLDLNFAVGTEVSFTTNGKGRIHLTGYINEEDEDSLTLDQLGDEEEEEEVVEEKGPKKRKRNQPELTSDVSEKKAKLLNGSATEELDEEEESDDPDFEEAEEEEDSAEEEEDEEDQEDTDSDEEVVEEEESTPAPQQKKSKKVKEQKSQKPQKNTLGLGVVTEDLVEGSGPEAKPGRFVTVHYEGRLQRNNKLFDSSNKGPGFKFRLGRGEVIKGWDLGVVGMKVGGKRKIICPPQAAYGAKGSLPAIPPNATLVFTVTLNNVK